MHFYCFAQIGCVIKLLKCAVPLLPHHSLASQLHVWIRILASFHVEARRAEKKCIGLPPHCPFLPTLLRYAIKTCGKCTNVTENWPWNVCYFWLHCFVQVTVQTSNGEKFDMDFIFGDLPRLGESVFWDVYSSLEIWNWVQINIKENDLFQLSKISPKALKWWVKVLIKKSRLLT